MFDCPNTNREAYSLYIQAPHYSAQHIYRLKYNYSFTLITNTLEDQAAAFICLALSGVTDIEVNSRPTGFGTLKWVK